MSSFIALAFLLTASLTASFVDGKLLLSGVDSVKGLSVVVAEGTEAEIAGRPAVSGEWKEAGGKFTFTPKYPLKAGTAYRIRGLAGKVEVQVPKAVAGPAAVLKQIHPTADELPENTLRFYLEFSRPMPRGDVYKYVTIVKDDGKAVEQPFLEIDDELWNDDQTRLTLLIDPGRIKQEVKPRLDLGPVFQKGKKYTLMVDGQWPTLDGGRLGATTRKAIRVNRPVADGVDPRAWKLTAPATGRAAVSLAFDRPMDHALLGRSLVVIGPDGQTVAGQATPTDRDRGWKFQPNADWGPGEYQIRVDPILEDVCGNGVDRPFETAIKPGARKILPVSLPFSVRR